MTRDQAEPEAHCVYCGATGQLVPDTELEETWYCPACLGRHEEHQAIIDHGCEDEEPSHE